MAKSLRKRSRKNLQKNRKTRKGGWPKFSKRIYTESDIIPKNERKGFFSNLFSNNRKREKQQEQQEQQEPKNELELIEALEKNELELIEALEKNKSEQKNVIKELNKQIEILNEQIKEKEVLNETIDEEIFKLTDERTYNMSIQSENKKKISNPDEKQKYLDSVEKFIKDYDLITRKISRLEDNIHSNKKEIKQYKVIINATKEKIERIKILSPFNLEI